MPIQCASNASTWAPTRLDQCTVECTVPSDSQSTVSLTIGGVASITTSPQPELRLMSNTADMEGDATLWATSCIPTLSTNNTIECVLPCFVIKVVDSASGVAVWPLFFTTATTVTHSSGRVNVTSVARIDTAPELQGFVLCGVVAPNYQDRFSLAYNMTVTVSFTFARGLTSQATFPVSSCRGTCRRRRLLWWVAWPASTSTPTPQKWLSLVTGLLQPLRSIFGAAYVVPSRLMSLEWCWTHYSVPTVVDVTGVSMDSV